MNWALARLGDELALLDTIADCYEVNGIRQTRGFDGLKYVGGPLSMRVLLDRLDDTYSAPREYDMLFWSPRDQALTVLSTLVHDPPVKFDMGARALAMALGSDAREKAVATWQEYFRHHPDMLRAPASMDWPLALNKAVATGDSRAILALGRLADRTLVPVLKRYQTDPKLAVDLATAVTMALARLGERESFDRIKEPAMDSDSALQENAAVDQLAYVGGKSGIETLAALLRGPSPRISAAAAADLAHLIAGFPSRGALPDQQRAVQEWLRTHD